MTRRYHAELCGTMEVPTFLSVIPRVPAWRVWDGHAFMYVGPRFSTEAGARALAHELDIAEAHYFQRVRDHLPMRRRADLP